MSNYMVNMPMIGRSYDDIVKTLKNNDWSPDKP